MSRTVTYSDVERQIVKAGFQAVREVLTGADRAAKERLLFCLDYYMDPYYGRQPAYIQELTALLEQLVISDNSLSVKEDALGLLIDYTWPPYPVLEAGMDKIEEVLLPDIRYAIKRGDTGAVT